MTFLLVTGAGASYNLAAGDDHLPLMSNWSDRLCEALDEAEPGLASACGLVPGLTGDEFEKALGLLLQWQRVRYLEKHFAGLGGPSPGHLYAGDVQNQRNNTERRLNQVVEVLRTTLSEQFSLDRVDDGRATEAYGTLLDAAGVSSSEPLIVATTNYDRAYEGALGALGRPADTGFAEPLGRAPILNPTGMVERASATRTPVIHLHGAVGWYEQEGSGSVLRHFGNLAYNPSFGTPVVLYPDPNKDPTNDAHVVLLWAEFDQAIEQADRIAVVGHSLHDEALVARLRDASANKPVVVTFYAKNEDERMRGLLPDAGLAQLDFGPKMKAPGQIAEALKRVAARDAASVRPR